MSLGCDYSELSTGIHGVCLCVFALAAVVFFWPNSSAFACDAGQIDIVTGPHAVDHYPPALLHRKLKHRRLVRLCCCSPLKPFPPKRNLLEITAKSLFGVSLEALLMVCVALPTKMLDDAHMSAKISAKCTRFVVLCVMRIYLGACSCQFELF